MDIYAELGIKKDTPKEEVKKIYKDFCKKNHPDIGGDTKEFQEKQQHYAILLDDTKRKRYDETGETGAINKHQKIVELSISLFEALFQENPDNIDDKVREYKSNVLNQINRNIKKNQQEKGKLEEFKKRIKLKNDEPNHIINHIDRKLENYGIGINKLIQDKKDQNEVFVYIEKNFIFENIEGNISRFGSMFEQNTGGTTGSMKWEM